ncbi:MAG: extracellular solute-binding protein [bacterium]|nr:extracellular solute-binding protein [bacterium]
MNDKMKLLLIGAGALSLIIVIVLVVVLLVSKKPNAQTGTSAISATQSITLKYWRAFDDTNTMDDIISSYTKEHPNVYIEYKKFRFEEYEKELLNALAEDRGPDIFSIHNTWVGAYRTKLAPMPDTLQVQRVGIVSSGLGSKLAGTIKTIAGYTPAFIRKTFVPAVADDVIFNDEKNQPRIYGLPLAVDTLALFYNPYLFNSAGIAQPPTNWDEFEADVKKLTIISPETHEILQAGAAFGGSRNIDRAVDILSSLMAQNGTVMSKAGRVTLNELSPYIKNSSLNPAAEALRFYTDFAWVTKADVYTWNTDQPNSVESFAQERAAMMFGYSYHIAQIKAKAPGLKFEVAPLPQKQPELKWTYANYWVEGVSEKSKYQDMAWDFIMYATSKENVKSYLETTKHPTALRELVDEQLADEQVKPFLSQVLIAGNWYHGLTPYVAEKAILDMIEIAFTQKGGDISHERGMMYTLIQRAQQTISDGY